MIKKQKQPWPTKAAMSQIYDLNLWGGNALEFYSGEGSHRPELVNPYVAVVTAFLKSFKTPITVCDLGCGDFNVGNQLVSYTKQYYAIDVVPELINYLKKTYHSKHLAFSCLDIATDTLPKADCVILRQVLQHLSNEEVLQITHKLSAYKYCIITEHTPATPFTPNIDIISGQGIRLKKQSGVDVLAPPFNLKIKSQKQLLSIPLNNHKECITTTLYTMG